MAGDAQGQSEENQVIGPYRLLWPFSEELGGDWQVYAARRIDTGSPALVMRPKKDTVWAPQKNWQGRVVGCTAPPYLGLDVDRLPDLNTLPAITDDLDALTTLCGLMEYRREAAEHLRSRPRKRREQGSQEDTHAVATPTLPATKLGEGNVRSEEPVAVELVEQSSPRPIRSATLRAWRPSWAALAVASLAALVLVPSTLHWQPSTPEPGMGSAALAGLAEEALTEPELLPAANLDMNTTQQSVVGLKMPPRPFPGQHLAPCRRPAREIELRDGSRACWIKIDITAEECKTDGYEWKGGCYLPSIPSQRGPSSTLPPRTPSAPAERAQ